MGTMQSLVKETVYNAASNFKNAAYEELDAFKNLRKTSEGKIPTTQQVMRVGVIGFITLSALWNTPRLAIPIMATIGGLTESALYGPADDEIEGETHRSPPTISGIIYNSIFGKKTKPQTSSPTSESAEGQTSSAEPTSESAQEKSTIGTQTLGREALAALKSQGSMEEKAQKISHDMKRWLRGLELVDCIALGAFAFFVRNSIDPAAVFSVTGRAVGYTLGQQLEKKWITPKYRTGQDAAETAAKKATFAMYAAEWAPPILLFCSVVTGVYGNAKGVLKCFSRLGLGTFIHSWLLYRGFISVRKDLGNVRACWKHEFTYKPSQKSSESKSD